MAKVRTSLPLHTTEYNKPEPTDKEKRYRKAMAEAKRKQEERKRKAWDRVSPENKKRIQKAKAKKNQARNYPN